MDEIIVTSAHTVAAGEFLDFYFDTPGVAAFLMDGRGANDPSLTIAGSVHLHIDESARIYGGSVYGIIFHYEGAYPTGVVRIEEAGRLKVEHFAGKGGAYGFYSMNHSSDLINEGQIEVRSNSSAVGVVTYEFDSYFDFANRGEIRVYGESSATGVQMLNGGDFMNSGLIEVRGASEGFGLCRGVRFGPYDGTFLNTGVIRAIGGNATQPGAAVDWVPDPSGRRSFVNSGVLEGEFSLLAFTQQHPREQVTFLFSNSGSMIGKVGFFSGDDRLENSGLITGEVSFGLGDDTYEGSAGSAQAMVAGGGGADSLVGGAGFDNFQGNQGNDTASGGLGDDWVVGGKDNDLLFGDAGADLVYGNLGNDTCEGGDGDDIVRGGQNDDVINGGAGDDYVSGDKGNDTVAGGAGADRFHTFGEAGIDRVLDFSIADGDRVQLDPGTQYTVAQTGADTVISMTGGGQMILVGVQMSALPDGWIFGA